jgi:ATP-dependent Clp protease ATP-binding subunit ClpA
MLIIIGCNSSQRTCSFREAPARVKPPLTSRMPDNGARPLKRAVQEQLLNPLSMKLLEGEFKPGDKIKVTTKADELVFARK